MDKRELGSNPTWENLLASRRLGDRPPKQELGRSPFNADHDKVVFSGAFRRLARKTQVHPLAKNDHIHNRLTHSLEVACVGRSLGIQVGLSLADRNLLPDKIAPSDIGDIVEASCLAHDIGNPPFGHTGEEAIRHWFSTEGGKYLKELTKAEQQDFTQFEGNAQGFRVLTTSEYYPNDGGMRLSYATLAASIKYPWTSTSPDVEKRPKASKFGIFQGELTYFREVAKAVGLRARIGDDWFVRHPLVYLMEAADDFCYGLLDLEDGLEMGILKWDEVYAILQPLIALDDRTRIEKELKAISAGRRPALVRGKVISRCVKSAAEAFIDYEPEILAGLHSDLIGLCDQDLREYVDRAKKTAQTEIFCHRRKVELEIGAYSALSTLLEVMCSAVVDYVDKKGQNLPFKVKRVVDLLGEDSLQIDSSTLKGSVVEDPKYFALMRVMDFISGMTDDYAVYLTRQFRGIGN